MKRGGELTSSQIVGIVLAVAAFIIVLFFLAVTFEDNGEKDRELCRLSVLTRATAGTALQAQVPLKCTTEKICVSEKGSLKSCPQFIGESNVRVVKLSGDDIAKARQIEKVSAEAMYQCWSAMGKGQLDIFGKAGDLFGSDGTSSCVICSRVAYGNDISNEILNRTNLESYLEREKIPVRDSTLTYLQAFTDRSARSFASLTSNVKINASEVGASAGQIRGDFNSRQIAFVFAQVKTTAWPDVLRNLGGAALGTSFAIPGASRLLGALFLTKAAIVAVPVTAAAVGAVAWNAYEGQKAAAGWCGKFTTSVDKNDKSLMEGCSLVQAVNYNVQDVNALCTGSIQGNP